MLTDSICTNWKPVLQDILLNFSNLENDIEEIFLGSKDIYPPKHLIFNAFNHFNIKDLKVIIIGQDPYHQPNQANGLAFSVQDGIKIPPSLINIFKEICNNLDISFSKPDSGDLTYLADQGILLLNNTLTVEKSKPNSHLKIWKGFTEKIIDYILENEKDIIFMLWGGNAKKILEKKDTSNHYIYKSNHPSPLSANRGGWFNLNMFNEVNLKLKELNKEEIKWLK
tara:strand:+ start:4116 stop:4790 length:675 start_codon:yes stop_codon:yes gene_type:complete